MSGSSQLWQTVGRHGVQHGVNRARGNMRVHVRAPALTRLLWKLRNMNEAGDEVVVMRG